MADALQRVLDTVQAAMKALESTFELAESFADMAPKVPSAIGLFAKDGISMGTTDRLVSAAGKGYVFIADGGTGQRDYWRFVPGFEELIATGVDFSFKDLYSSEDETTSGSGGHGFTVLSNSDANIITRSNLELLAIGSQLAPREAGQASSEPPAHPTALGKGVARLAATRRTEVLATNEVLIAAGSALGNGAPLHSEEQQTVAGESQVKVHAHEISIGAYEPPEGAQNGRAGCAHVDHIPWPKPGCDPQTKALTSRWQDRVLQTSRVDVRANEAILLMLGATGRDREHARGRLAHAETAREWDRDISDRLRDEQEVARGEGNMERLAELETLVACSEARVAESEAEVERLDRLVQLMNDATGPIRPAIDIQPHEIRIGFCDSTDNRNSTRWGPHLRITADDIKLMAGDNSPMSVCVNERAASVCGRGDSVSVGDRGWESNDVQVV